MKIKKPLCILIILKISFNLNANLKTEFSIDSIVNENKLVVDTFDNGITTNRIFIRLTDRESKNVFKDKIITTNIPKKTYNFQSSKNKIDYLSSQSCIRKNFIKETNQMKQDFGTGPVNTKFVILLAIVALGLLVLAFLGLKYAVNKGWIVIR